MNKYPRIGFLTDTHVMGNTPSGRDDDFYTAILGKLEECGDIWEQNDVDFVLHGGDLFHTYDPSRGVYTDVAKILRAWNKDIYLTIGSHDYYGYQMKSLRRSGIGSLRASGVIEILGGGGIDDGISDWVRMSNVGEEKLNVVVYGNRHTYWFADTPETLSLKLVPDAFLVQVVHGDLVDKPTPWPHILLETVNTDAQLVLSGHYHPGWSKPIKRGNTQFFNPGSVARLENTGVQRTPRVCIITVKDNRSCDIETIELSSVSEHPFKEKKEAEVAIQQDIVNILNLMGRKDVESIDFKKEIPNVAKELNLNTDVVTRAFKYIDTLKEI